MLEKGKVGNKQRVIADPSRLEALKMDGAKQATETLDFERKCREVFCRGRSMALRLCGPCRNKNLAESSNEAC